MDEFHISHTELIKLSEVQRKLSHGLCVTQHQVDGPDNDTDLVSLKFVPILIFSILYCVTVKSALKTLFSILCLHHSFTSSPTVVKL